MINPQGARRARVVHLAVDADEAGHLHWFGYADYAGDASDVEQMPEGLTDDAAVTWARGLSSRVVIRDQRHQVWWAGSDPQPDDINLTWPS